MGNEQETAFLAALQKAESYHITLDGFLQIEYGAGLLSSETLFFGLGQARLKNTQWVLQAYGNPEALQRVEPATTITAVFTGQPSFDQGVIVGFGGCNSYAADYVVQDNRLIVRPAAAAIDGPEQVAVGQEVTFQGGNSTPGSSPSTG